MPQVAVISSTGSVKAGDQVGGRPSAGDSMRPWITAFVERLRDLGWIEDRTIAIAYRWAEGHPERYARDCGRVCSSQRQRHRHDGTRSSPSKKGDIGHPDCSRVCARCEDCPRWRMDRGASERHPTEGVSMGAARSKSALRYFLHVAVATHSHGAPGAFR
jgi:hypothetical protein